MAKHLTITPWSHILLLTTESPQANCAVSLALPSIEFLYELLIIFIVLVMKVFVCHGSLCPLNLYCESVVLEDFGHLIRRNQVDILNNLDGTNTTLFTPHFPEFSAFPRFAIRLWLLKRILKRFMAKGQLPASWVSLRRRVESFCLWRSFFLAWKSIERLFPPKPLPLLLIMSFAVLSHWRRRSN